MRCLLRSIFIVVLVSIAGSVPGWTAPSQRFDITGNNFVPISVDLTSSGEIHIRYNGLIVLEQGKFFVSRRGSRSMEQLPIRSAHIIKLESKRVLLPIPSTIREVELELECEPSQFVHFAIRGLSVSLGGAPQPGITYWFSGRVDWGDDPWLVRTSSSRNPEVFQVASGAVTNLNLNTLYDRTRDRALVLTGSRLKLVPERYGRTSPYLVTTETSNIEQPEEPEASPLFVGALYEPPGPRRKLLALREVDNVLGKQVPFFQPMTARELKKFPSALSGWISIYGGMRRDKSEAEFWKNLEFSRHYEENVIRGADWFARNLPPDAYGPINIGVNDLQGQREIPHKRWVLGSTPDLIDQHRDWRVQCTEIFPHGAKWLADQMHKRGMQLGSWLIPDAWDAEELYLKHPDWFLRYPDGTPIHFGWVGRFLLDGSNPTAVEFLRNEMHKYSHEWGIDNFYVDGNGNDLLDQLSTVQSYFYNKNVPWWEAHRRLIQAIRDGAGADAYIHMDSPMSLTAMGIANGSRTGGDPNLNDLTIYGDGGCCMNWGSATTALSGTMNWYFLNRTGWYNDPSDAFLLG